MHTYSSGLEVWKSFIQSFTCAKALWGVAESLQTQLSRNKIYSTKSKSRYLWACASNTGASQGPRSTNNFSVLNISPFSSATVTGLCRVNSESNKTCVINHFIKHAI